MLSQTAEHALRAVLYLARSGDRAVPADVIASALGAPANYLAKTLHALAKAGVVAGTRGPHGGFRLVTLPAELTVARVIETFDAAALNQTCLTGGRACDHTNPCIAHRRWIEVLAAVRRPLLSTTIAELLEGEPLPLQQAV